ncbi:hypothetical protein OAN33_02510 [Flavobacteriales bacterium]|nr:hypothetical protein [Flavobacteriales bacterium]
MKKIVIALCILSAFFAGACLTSLLKKEKVIFVHKQCDEGKCISFKDLYMIEEGLDDIRHYTSMTGWEDKIVNRTREINQIIK